VSDAGIIFADLLLPLESPWDCVRVSGRRGAGRSSSVRTAEECACASAPNRADELALWRVHPEVASHFRTGSALSEFAGAPYTLASYMIEGGGSKNYIHTKQMDVPRDTFRGVCSSIAGKGARSVLPSPGAGGRGRDPDLRQLGWVAGLTELYRE